MNFDDANLAASLQGNYSRKKSHILLAPTNFVNVSGRCSQMEKNYINHGKTPNFVIELRILNSFSIRSQHLKVLTIFSAAPHKCFVAPEPHTCSEYVDQKKKVVIFFVSRNFGIFSLSSRFSMYYHFRLSTVCGKQLNVFTQFICHY